MHVLSFKHSTWIDKLVGQKRRESSVFNTHPKNIKIHNNITKPNEVHSPEMTNTNRILRSSFMAQSERIPQEEFEE